MIFKGYVELLGFTCQYVWLHKEDGPGVGLGWV